MASALRNILILFTLTSFALAATARAEDDAPPRDDVADYPVNITIYWENDVRFLKPNHDTDRYYTNGSAISVAYQPDWADRLASYVPFAKLTGVGDEPDTAAGLTFGQLIFTPENISNPNLILGDRPYAGYLYGGVFWQRANDTTIDHFQLDLGIIGPSSLAEDAQKWVHDNISGIDPRGWDNQLADEPTVQFHFRKKWRIDLPRIRPFDIPLDSQLIPHLGTSLGTVYLNVQGGATARIGFNLPDDFGPRRLDDVGAFTGGLREGFGVYVFFRGTGRVVGHDTLIEGNVFESSHGREAEALVGQMQFGAAVQYRRGRWSFEGTYSQTFTTREFDRQDGTHAYGAAVLSLTYRF